MAISDQIYRIISGKNKIKTVVANRGVIIPDDALIDEYDTYINQIPSGGAQISQESDKVVKII